MDAITYSQQDLILQAPQRRQSFRQLKKKMSITDFTIKDLCCITQKSEQASDRQKCPAFTFQEPQSALSIQDIKIYRTFKYLVVEDTMEEDKMIQKYKRDPFFRRKLDYELSVLRKSYDLDKMVRNRKKQNDNGEEIGSIKRIGEQNLTTFRDLKFKLWDSNSSKMRKFQELVNQMNS